ncbi:arginine-tRNA ligase cytoplasmic-like [Trifolium pratense]|uniref:arginine--tRNA ligase n=1 Tax=Trifolium pratense TaxID=57577 RepID=A0A2K3NQM0_TRIPR|nr:arginine-tRNA ligase cytoplasmic-like [Trifolium pratense]
MIIELDCPSSVRKQLGKLFAEALKQTVPTELEIVPLIDACIPKDGVKHADYQCNNAMSLFAKIKGKQEEFKNPRSLGEGIMKNLPPSEMIESCSVAGPGFVNIVLSNKWIAQRVQKMLTDGIDSWAPRLPIKRVLVDFSSPNIAKEMHVGHLRSTIIGDTLARMLEFCQPECLIRRNHLGDWGTQFGMLIAHHFEKFPNSDNVNESNIGDLQAFYKESKLKFDSDPDFKLNAQQSVVKLQGGDPKYRKAWEQICNISRTEFNKVYQRLGIHLEEMPESFYNELIPPTLEKLDKLGLIEDSDGARVIFVDGVDIPLIAVKKDGGYNYFSTDLASLWYRLNIEKLDWNIYVTDVGQWQHFDMLFKAFRRAGWLPKDENEYPICTHIGFGLVLGKDGKRLRSSLGETVRLVDLLDKAKEKSKIALLKRGNTKEWSEEEIEKASEAIGYGAVKYADLKNNRTTNYTINFEQMLNDKGNTAVYLIYAHARICSIIRKSGKDIEELKKTGTVVLDHEDERTLALHLLQFTEVVGSPEETSRLLLCEATLVVMRHCFYLLGIVPVDKL